MSYSFGPCIGTGFCMQVVYCVATAELIHNITRNVQHVYCALPGVHNGVTEKEREGVCNCSHGSPVTTFNFKTHAYCFID